MKIKPWLSRDRESHIRFQSWYVHLSWADPVKLAFQAIYLSNAGPMEIGYLNAISGYVPSDNSCVHTVDPHGTLEFENDDKLDPEGTFFWGQKILTVVTLFLRKYTPILFFCSSHFRSYFFSAPYNEKVIL